MKITQTEKTPSPRRMREILKRADRAAAWFMRFNPGYRIRLSGIRELTAGLIHKHDNQKQYLIHRKINANAQGGIKNKLSRFKKRRRK